MHATLHIARSSVSPTDEQGSDTTGDGSKAELFRAIQRALKAVSSARARLGGRGGGASGPFLTAWSPRRTYMYAAVEEGL